RSAKLKWISAGVASAAIAAVSLATAGTARAADPRAELFQKFQTAVKGKTVAWVPVWLGVLESEWTRVMKAHFDDYGVKLKVRDPPGRGDCCLFPRHDEGRDRDPQRRQVDQDRLLAADQLGRQQGGRRHHQRAAAEPRPVRYPQRLGPADRGCGPSGQECRQA